MMQRLTERLSSNIAEQLGISIQAAVELKKTARKNKLKTATVTRNNVTLKCPHITITVHRDYFPVNCITINTKRDHETPLTSGRLFDFRDALAIIDKAARTYTPRTPKWWQIN